MAENVSPLSPHPAIPERVTPVYERKMASNPARRGPLRFEEGIASDTDVPNDFSLGVNNGYVTAPGRPNRVAPTWVQPPEKTLQQRAHVGSASWVEAPTYLGEFAHGGLGNNGEVEFEQVVRSGGHYMRTNPAQVND
ncbi:hypothetical protein ACIBCT_35810 [Streptosporangium sp. NPDC050855]|uniref:hypothetical protein n=1 Tax=Streptosporangium sp. NPDC050855 TaxID=3366194 RepID=UPI003787FE90